MQAAGTATIHVAGDSELAAVLDELGAAARRADVDRVVVDLTGTMRLPLAAVATIARGKQLAADRGKAFEITAAGGQPRAALALAEVPVHPPPPLEPPPPVLERVGGRVVDATSSVRALGRLVVRALHQAVEVALRRHRLPAGSLALQLDQMGVDAVPIVGLLTFLLGMTTAFQGAVQLQRFGATPLVADLIGLSMVRELAPLMTAVILTGRTGAAIAAELGTMHVRGEIDALSAMGIDPVRFLVVPRLVAISLIQPALTLIAMFIGIAGGIVVGVLALNLSATAFWTELGETLVGNDFIYGLEKSLVFAWIVGLTGCHLGMRAGRDSGAVGRATTRTVVACVFAIICADAVFALLSNRRYV
jgi:phospholipid/cholesterol/gamma-HCH transport system permease protein